jgi:predicted ester cyclase
MSAEDSKLVFRRYLEEFHSQGQLELADEILGTPLRESTLGLARMLRTAFPDVHIRVLEQVAEGDKVATVWEAEGIHEGEWQSPIGPIPATKRHISWGGTTTVRIANAQMVDVIGSNWDHLGMLQQMGVIPNTAPRSGA